MVACADTSDSVAELAAMISRIGVSAGADKLKLSHGALSHWAQRRKITT
jgi:hypothetical protein